ncbi:MAG: bifunctional phosphopantothenoylcysteine decarboxylase/phosphopantothenate--cysteine ligase CoaBC [Thermoplasmata archaeon]|nr:bifunctional phosphopantothenoylcysteine decarboxylase/phosphopantothenate--cysteine ligase CoaBC [Thermoplasmata archaeon]
MHPAKDIECSKSEKLKGRKIVLGVTGSIAAVDSVKLCRELVRHGAEVHVVMSGEAQKVIHPYSLEFASGNAVTTEIDGRVQHVAFCGYVPDKADLLLIAPATANTISKIAHGIDDTPVTTFATTAIGTGIPVIVVPAMHGSMIHNKIVLDNVNRLRENGVIVLEAKMAEAKAKMPGMEDIVAAAISQIGRGDMRGIDVLVIAGSTEEQVDDIRLITNKSSGETGIELAKAAYERGANVELWMGRCDVAVPLYLKTTRFSSTASLKELVDGMSERDIVLFPAAVSDYSPDRYSGKIPSTDEFITLTLRRNPKLIDSVKAKTVVGFKAQSRIEDDILVAEAEDLIRRSGCAFVVANKVEQVSSGSTRVLMVGVNGSTVEISGAKKIVADKILDRAMKR